MKRYACLALIALAAVSTVTHAADSTPPSIEDQLKQEAKGVGRFRGGWYGSIGYVSSSKQSTATDGQVKLGGFPLEGGIYGLFNPIRDFADIEAGLGLKVILPTESSGNGSGTTYSYGYSALSAYAGPVFRLGGESSIAVGGFIDKPFSILKSSTDPFFKTHSGKPKSALGGYVEYQYSKGQDRTIYFTRFTAGHANAEFTNVSSAFNDSTSSTRFVGISIGAKY